MLNNIPDHIGVRLNYRDKDALEKLSESIKGFLLSNTLILCIGTDKCIGDCLGPLVGTFLERNSFPYPIIGTLENPAHAVNLDRVVKHIKEKYNNPFIIAVDACLGYSECVGDIQVKLGPVHPGKGVGKNLPHIGDISIVGVVDTIDNSDLFTIKNIRLNFIMKMAETIANAFKLANKE